LDSATILRIGYWVVFTAGMLGLIAAGAAVRNRHRVDRIILEAARQEGIRPALVAAVVWRESRFDPAAAGSHGEIGLMQVTGGAAADWAREHRLESFSLDALWHPVTNVTVGAWYLGRATRYWADQGCGDPLPFALAEYNAGRSKVQDWIRISGPDADRFIEVIAIDSTRGYVQDVLRRYRRTSD
jgi:soluble lytic murein transglycosylase